MVCRYLEFVKKPFLALDVKERDSLNTYQHAAVCTDRHKDCPKKKIAGVVTPHCWRFK